MGTHRTRQSDLHLTLQPQASIIGLGLRPGRFSPGPTVTHYRLEAVQRLILPAVLTSVPLHRDPSIVALHCARTLTCPPDHQQSQIPQIEAMMDLEHTSNQSDTFCPSWWKMLDISCPANEPVAAPRVTGDYSPDEDSICHECRQVDWDGLPTLAESFRNEYLSRTIRTMEANREQLATSSCKICRILSVVMPRSLDETEYVVKARSLSDCCAYAVPDRSKTASKTGAKTGSKAGEMITALQVWPRGRLTFRDAVDSKCLVAIKRDSERFTSKTIAPGSIDYGLLKGLMPPRPKVETKVESNIAYSWPRPLSKPLEVKVPGLMVIEVSSRAVITAPKGCQYVALSYVWGKQQDIDSASILHRPPPLIEDAISVTIAMGYEYLWVDRYVSLYSMTNMNAFIQI